MTGLRVYLQFLGRKKRNTPQGKRSHTPPVRIALSYIVPVAIIVLGFERENDHLARRIGRIHRNQVLLQILQSELQRAIAFTRDGVIIPSYGITFFAASLRRSTRASRS